MTKKKSPPPIKSIEELESQGEQELQDDDNLLQTNADAILNGFIETEPELQPEDDEIAHKNNKKQLNEFLDTLVDEAKEATEKVYGVGSYEETNTEHFTEPTHGIPEATLRDADEARAERARSYAPELPSYDVDGNETKAGAFRRLGLQRTELAVDRIQKIGRLATPGAYDYTDEQVVTILTALHDAISQLDNTFRNSKPPKIEL